MCCRATRIFFFWSFGPGGGGFERERQIARGLKPRRRTLLQTAIDDAHERGRNLALGGRQVRRMVLDDGRHRVHRGLAVERALAREHLVEHGAERKDVRAMIGRHAAHLLGRHVADRAEHHARQGVGRCRRQGRCDSDRRLRLRQLGQTEVQNLHAAVVGDEHVLRFEIAVDDALSRAPPPGRARSAMATSMALRTGTRRPDADPLAQRLAFEQLR